MSPSRRDGVRERLSANDTVPALGAGEGLAHHTRDASPESGSA
jgi:hypothetical protein